MPRAVSFDVLAARAILNNDQATLKRLRTAVQYTTGSLCPECNSRNIEDNGYATAFICLSCEHQWDA